MKNPVAAHKQVGDKRYREVSGLYFDDFEVGDVFEHRPGRTVTNTDNIWGSLLAMNPHPLHIDAAYCEHTEFGELLVSSLVTFSIVNAMTVTSTSFKAIANLGWDKVRLTGPVFAGDTLYAESEVLSKRESKSRPGQGIVTVRTRGLKQDGSEIMHFERTFLVPVRGSETVESKAGY